MLEKILDFLEKHLPGLLMAFGLGYKLGKKTERDIKIKAAQLELENALLKNKEAVNNRFDGMSDSDIIDSVSGPGPDEDPK